MEVRVTELEEQRQSLNATIAGLTAQAGTGWSAASRLSELMKADGADGAGGAPAEGNGAG